MTTTTPTRLDTDITALPATPGIYRFWGEGETLLYIGKSINIRQRVRTHFQNTAPRARRMCQQTCRIEYTETAGELGALLLENREIKQRQPVFNRRQRRYRQLQTWLLSHNEKGFLVPHRYQPDPQHPLWQQDCYGLFRSPRQAQQALEHWVREARLCPNICGLEQGPGPCFSFQLQRCQGACCGKESVASHNRRLLAALETQQIQAWPYDGILVIHEQGESGEDFHLIHQWCHLTTLPHPPTREDLDHFEDAVFDLDSYRMLLHFINRGAHCFVME
ncbi:MAG: GIY-YIG nuclease family protein [Pseudomonadota bacterium]|uniref:GIY-YIG nuclease family protein n=1 Tax=Alcanivorax sp. TaxID=1872427 RepID=UPI002438055C|nr:GIY-YIG nuclease family protein [Alcanivorax sp.]MED5238180.1 GIY-YIG nuclease family protein [Pseudomonadota bacterium]MEE3320948.1 GIY-YIG nuclease family protein [Pseudomonadota bacterium]